LIVLLKEIDLEEVQAVQEATEGQEVELVDLAAKEEVLEVQMLI
jgi:hypothetical protein